MLPPQQITSHKHMGFGVQIKPNFVLQVRCKSQQGALPRQLSEQGLAVLVTRDQVVHFHILYKLAALVG